MARLDLAIHLDLFIYDYSCYRLFYLTYFVKIPEYFRGQREEESRNARTLDRYVEKFVNIHRGGKNSLPNRNSTVNVRFGWLSFPAFYRTSSGGLCILKWTPLCAVIRKTDLLGFLTRSTLVPLFTRNITIIRLNQYNKDER